MSKLMSSDFLNENMDKYTILDWTVVSALGIRNTEETPTIPSISKTLFLLTSKMN